MVSSGAEPVGTIVKQWETFAQDNYGCSGDELSWCCCVESHKAELNMARMGRPLPPMSAGSLETLWKAGVFKGPCIINFERVDELLRIRDRHRLLK